MAALLTSKDPCAGIKATVVVIVGIYNRYSDQAAQNAALVRRFGSRS
jgi:hypothetical protein